MNYLILTHVITSYAYFSIITTGSLYYPLLEFIYMIFRGHKMMGSMLVKEVSILSSNLTYSITIY